LPLRGLPVHFPLSKKLIKYIGRAIGDFGLISNGDRILVGLSGGKDSILLLLALTEILGKSPIKFQIEACTVDMTNGRMDTSAMEELCCSLGVPYHVRCHPIEEIIHIRDERSPCSFCANIRRGILCSTASERKCNSIALGHNLDDVSETTLINLFRTGKFRCFMPKLWQSRSKVWIIRPLVYIEERLILNESARLGFNIVVNPCQYSGNTERERAKELIGDISVNIPDIRTKILGALLKLNENDKWLRQQWKRK